MMVVWFWEEEQALGLGRDEEHVQKMNKIF